MVNRPLITSLIFGITWCISMPLWAFSVLQSQVDKNPALAGEAITLTVTADARLPANQLNYRVLEQDFNVMTPSVSQSTQIVNGQASQNTSWVITLFPLRSGDFTIPAFEINGISSSPINLTVLAQASSAGQPQPLLVEATLQGRHDVYVQQMLYYDVVIYFSGDLQRGNLTEPQLEGAEISRLGQDVEGTALRDGQRYRTITRRYTITPQRSGEVTITAPLFTGEMIERDNSRYNYFAQSKTLMQEGNPITLSVKPQPNTMNGQWLVAALVTLTEEWQPDTPELTVGEPVTRIITLSAVDVAASQLPDIEQRLPANVRHYQEQAQAKSAERSGRLVAQKVFTTAIIANENGELTLPEVRLPWWNSQTNQQDVAILPAKKLSATGGSTIAVTPAMPSEETQQPTTSTSWQWNYLSTLLLSGWLLSLLAIWPFRARLAGMPVREWHTADAPHGPALPFNDTLFKHACREGDAATASQQLLLWGEQSFNVPMLSLSQLANQLAHPALAAELMHLAQHLYGANVNTGWQGDALYDGWRSWQARPTSVAKTPLQSLYPL